MDKLRSRRGETLTETLAAILLVTFSSGILLTAVMAATRIGLLARTADDALRAEQETAERQRDGTAGTVTVRVQNGASYTYDVERFGGEDGGLSSYRWEATP